MDFVFENDFGIEPPKKFKTFEISFFLSKTNKSILAKNKNLIERLRP